MPKKPSVPAGRRRSLLWKAVLGLVLLSFLAATLLTSGFGLIGRTNTEPPPDITTEQNPTGLPAYPGAIPRPDVSAQVLEDIQALLDEGPPPPTKIASFSVTAPYAEVITWYDQNLADMEGLVFYDKGASGGVFRVENPYGEVVITPDGTTPGDTLIVLLRQ